MTLTLDDVRNTKFRMARRSGYEVVDVDQFVDQVEEAFAQLTEENQMLKSQIAALKSGTAAPAGQDDRGDESATQQGRSDGQEGQGFGREPGAAMPAAATAVVGEGGERVVVTTSAEASPAVVRLVQLATEQAERLMAEAGEEATQTIEEAKRTAHQVTTDARTKAERIESEARVNAEKMRSDAQGRATDLDREIEDRRRETFSHLEQERDQLTSSVEELREFEATFRASFTAHLKGQVDSLERANFEPDNTPGLLSDVSDNSAAGRRGRRGDGPAGTNRNADQRADGHGVRNGHGVRGHSR